MQTCQLQYAKAHLSRIVQKVLAGEAQEISLRGEPVVIIISKKEYEKLKKTKTTKKTFLQFMLQSPLKGINLKLKRDMSLTRDDIEL